MECATNTEVGEYWWRMKLNDPKGGRWTDAAMLYGNRSEITRTEESRLWYKFRLDSRQVTAHPTDVAARTMEDFGLQGA